MSIEPSPSQWGQWGQSGSPTPPAGPTPGPPAPGRPDAERAAAKRTILGGAALLALGVIVTVLTYALASDGGGTYLVMWGPMIFGAITLVKGFVQLRRAA